MAVVNPFDFFVEDIAKDLPLVDADELKKELAPYLEIEPPGPLLARYLGGIARTAPSTIDFLCDVNRKLQSDIRYLVRREPGVQTAEQTLQLASGSCRDSG